MTSDLWTPGGYVTPDKRKKDGGSYFDDEMQTNSDAYTKLQKQSLEMRRQLNERPDHTVFVASAEAREEMRKVLNFWRSKGEINGVPEIRIDYGVADGEIRIGER